MTSAAGSASWRGRRCSFAALAVPLDDPALVVALVLAVRSERMMLGGDTPDGCGGIQMLTIQPPLRDVEEVASWERRRDGRGGMRI